MSVEGMMFNWFVVIVWSGVNKELFEIIEFVMNMLIYFKIGERIGNVLLVEENVSLSVDDILE